MRNALPRGADHRDSSRIKVGALRAPDSTHALGATAEHRGAVAGERVFPERAPIPTPSTKDSLQRSAVESARSAPIEARPWIHMFVQSVTGKLEAPMRLQRMQHPVLGVSRGTAAVTGHSNLSTERSLESDRPGRIGAPSAKMEGADLLRSAPVFRVDGRILPPAAIGRETPPRLSCLPGNDSAGSGDGGCAGVAPVARWIHAEAAALRRVPLAPTRVLPPRPAVASTQLHDGPSVLLPPVALSPPAPRRPRRPRRAGMGSRRNTQAVHDHISQQDGWLQQQSPKPDTTALGTFSPKPPTLPTLLILDASQLYATGSATLPKASSLGARPVTVASRASSSLEADLEIRDRTTSSPLSSTNESTGGLTCTPLLRPSTTEHKLGRPPKWMGRSEPAPTTWWPVRPQHQQAAGEGQPGPRVQAAQITLSRPERHHPSAHALAPSSTTTAVVPPVMGGPISMAREFQQPEVASDSVAPLPASAHVRVAADPDYYQPSPLAAVQRVALAASPRRSEQQEHSVGSPLKARGGRLLGWEHDAEQQTSPGGLADWGLE